MIYLGKDPVGISNVVSTTEVYQSIIVPTPTTSGTNSQTITFQVIGKPDAFMICALKMDQSQVASGYGCTSAVGFWTEYQGGQYAGGRAGGLNASGTEDHWQVQPGNITYNEDNNTFTFFTNSAVRFINGWTYSLYYVLNHREEVTNNG